MFFKRNHFSGLVVHTRHGCAERSADIGRVADCIFLAVAYQVIATDVLVKANRRCQMPGIVEQHHIQLQQVAYQTREQNGSIFTVAIGVVERLGGKERAVVSPYLIIVLILKSRVLVLCRCIGTPDYASIIMD